MNDLMRLLAFAFRRKGAERLAGTELRLLLAYDLRWFAPEDAKRVVQHAKDVGLLVEEGDQLRLPFDAAAVELPLSFRPTLAVLEDEAPAQMPRAAPTPAAPPPPVPKPDDEVTTLARAERARLGDGMSLDVARLLVRRRRGEDVREDAAHLEGVLLGH